MICNTASYSVYATLALCESTILLGVYFNFSHDSASCLFQLHKVMSIKSVVLTQIRTTDTSQRDTQQVSENTLGQHLLRRRRSREEGWWHLKSRQQIQQRCFHFEENTWRGLLVLLLQCQVRQQTMTTTILTLIVVLQDHLENEIHEISKCEGKEKIRLTQ
jgi:hypothetical protein